MCAHTDQDIERGARGDKKLTYKLQELVDIDVLLWVDGRFKQRLKDVRQQLFEVVHHRVLTIHVTVNGQTTDGQTDRPQSVTHCIAVDGDSSATRQEIIINIFLFLFLFVRKCVTATQAITHYKARYMYNTYRSTLSN